MGTSISLKKVYGGQLAPIDQVIIAIAEQTDPRVMADFASRAQAMRTIDKDNGQRSRYWGELTVWSERRLGELLIEGKDAGTIQKQGKMKKTQAAFLTLSDLGLEDSKAARAQKLARIPEDTIRAFIQRQNEEEEDIFKAGVLRFAGSDGTICAKHNNDVVDWYTPEKYIEAAREVMGSIDVDPASNLCAQKIVKAGRFYTAKDSGLDADWPGNVFLNPPFKMPLVEQFIFRLCEQVESNKTTQAILLTNNNTDTKWWQRAACIASAICFTAGRVSFYNKAGDWSAPTNGQTFCYFGRRAVAFCKRFKEFGLCLPK